MRRYFLIGLLLCFSCRSDTSLQKENEVQTDKEHVRLDEKKISTTGNPRFNFFFDHPKEWKIADLSETGDGFFILTGDSSIDMRIFGQHRVSSDEEYYSMLMKNGGSLNEFDFLDGATGTHITTNTVHYFIRNEGSIRISFYIASPSDWYTSNEEVILHIAHSIRMGSEE